MGGFRPPVKLKRVILGDLCIPLWTQAFRSVLSLNVAGFFKCEYDSSNLHETIETDSDVVTYTDTEFGFTFFYPFGTDHGKAHQAT